MSKYLFSRILQTIPVIAGVALIAFVLSELSGNPVRASLGQHANPETIKKVEAFYGYDKPAYVRFGRYVGNLSAGNMGVSISKEGVPVTELIVNGMSVTLKIALGAMLIAIAIGLGSGILSAFRPNSVLDFTSLSFASLGVSFPAFFLGMLLLLVFSVRLHWFPIGGYVSGSLSHIALPCISLGLISTASIARLSRNCLLETLSHEYIRMARAKGMGPWSVLIGHALPNALVPVVTIIGGDFASLMVGAVLTETVFQVPGIGSVISNAIFERDLPVVMGCCVFFALIFVTVNLIVDVSYAFLDPRIRHESNSQPRMLGSAIIRSVLTILLLTTFIVIRRNPRIQTILALVLPYLKIKFMAFIWFLQLPQIQIGLVIGFLALLCFSKRGRAAIKMFVTISKSFSTPLRNLLSNNISRFALVIVAFMVLIALTANFTAPFSFSIQSRGVEHHSPELAHWFGTDSLGRDILSRVMYGSQISMLIGICATALALLIGINVGLFAGYFGGLCDAVLMRATDTVAAFPSILLAVAITALFEKPRIWIVFVALGLAGWTSIARVVRSQVLTIKTLDYITAARALGVSDLNIIFRHVLPNCLPPIIVVGTLAIGGNILGEAGLSFLGLGVQDPFPSWGGMLNDARNNFTDHWWVAVFPGLAIVLTVMAFNLLGDGLRDALDPRNSRKE